MYKQFIKEQLAKMGYIGKYDERHVEAFIRIEHSTLDGLSLKQFENEIKIAIECINEVGTKESEKYALSFGL